MYACDGNPPDPASRQAHKPSVSSSVSVDSSGIHVFVEIDPPTSHPDHGSAADLAESPVPQVKGAVSDDAEAAPFGNGELDAAGEVTWHQAKLFDHLDDRDICGLSEASNDIGMDGRDAYPMQTFKSNNDRCRRNREYHAAPADGRGTMLGHLSPRQTGACNGQHVSALPIAQRG